MSVWLFAEQYSLSVVSKIELSVDTNYYDANYQRRTCGDKGIYTSVIDTQSESHYLLFVLWKLVLSDADQ